MTMEFKYSFKRRKMKLAAVCFVAFLSLEFAEGSFSYDGYKLYQVTPKTRDEADLLKEFEHDLNFDFWSEIRFLNAPVDIMVTPDAQYKFEAIMKRESIAYDILIENVEECFLDKLTWDEPISMWRLPMPLAPILGFSLADKLFLVSVMRISKKIQAENNRQRSTRVTRGEVSFTEFMRHGDILAYLDKLAEEHPEIATTEVIGKSFEGRNLTVLRISSGGSNKPVIFIEACIHAREWISPPNALYIIHQLVENSENAEMFSDVDWVILPVVNPDGYEYSHTDTRLWRKTRTPGTICYGTDANRNFDFNWMLIGASSWQCTETYAGRAAFSEPEAQAVGDFFSANNGSIKLYLDLHSYGPWILHPWGHTDVPPENEEELKLLGNRVNDAISAVRGTTYGVGSSNELLYPLSGGSRDYAAGPGGVPLSYTIELPGGGSAGFDPPASDILPVVGETWEGIKVFYEHISQQYAN